MMNIKKRMMITVVAVSVAVLLTLSAIVVVLVAKNATADTYVSMSYTVEGVAVRVSATGTVGTAKYPLTYGDIDVLELAPYNTSGTLTHSDNKLMLNYDNSQIIYEFVFTNMLDDVACNISLTSVPATKTNVSLGYVYSDTKIDDYSTLSTSATYQTQNLSAGKNTTKYIYIVCSVVDLMEDARLLGDFAWSLTEAA